jgi:hypothetical protein
LLLGKYYTTRSQCPNYIKVEKVLDDPIYFLRTNGSLNNGKY